MLGLLAPTLVALVAALVLRGSLSHLFGRRLEMLTLAVLSQLGAAGNWHRIAREWIYGDPPVTELGQLEAEFLNRRAAA